MGTRMRREISFRNQSRRLQLLKTDISEHCRARSQRYLTIRSHMPADWLGSDSGHSFFLPQFHLCPVDSKGNTLTFSWRTTTVIIDHLTINMGVKTKKKRKTKENERKKEKKKGEKNLKRTLPNQVTTG